MQSCAVVANTVEQYCATSVRHVFALKNVTSAQTNKTHATKSFLFWLGRKKQPATFSLPCCNWGKKKNDCKHVFPIYYEYDKSFFFFDFQRKSFLLPVKTVQNLWSAEHHDLLSNEQDTVLISGEPSQTIWPIEKLRVLSRGFDSLKRFVLAYS